MPVGLVGGATKVHPTAQATLKILGRRILEVIRRVGETKGQDSESILARAGARLNAGDLDGAIAQMQSLKGAARATAQVWLNDALARQAIARSTTALATRLAHVLAAP